MIMAEHLRYDELYRSLEINGKLINARELLARAAARWPDKKMVICHEKSITYREVYNKALDFAHTLRKEGVKKGERVVIFYENSIEFYIAYFAVWLAGGIVAPLNVFLTEHEFLKIVHDAQPRVIIISAHLKEKINAIAHRTLPVMVSTIEKDSRTLNTSPLSQEEMDNDSLAALLYTSGTTGFPKGVMLSSNNIVINAIQGIARFEVSPHERVFVHYHSFTHCHKISASGRQRLLVPPRLSLKK